MKKILLAMVMCVCMLCCFSACGDTSSDSGSSDNEAVAEETATEDVVSEVEEQGKELPGGTYVIGEDIPAGKYNFTYTTEMSEDDYWGLDFFWITRAGSEGENETLGGDKYDERFGGYEYGAASKGKTFFVNLKDGDSI
ncbi:MAG: hypothetical protein ACSW8G_07700, partial [Bacillota bacterium]